MCGAAGSNALMSAQNLAASQNINFASMQMCFLSHDGKVDDGELSKLLM